jgi:hypothetical protein
VGDPLPHSSECVEGKFSEPRRMKKILRHDNRGRVGEADEQKYTRRTARQALRLALLGMLVVLTVSSCEGGGPVEAKARTIPQQGPLSAGRYSTQEFEPSFSLELGKGWHVWYPEEPYSVELAEGEGNDKQLTFYKVQEVFESRKDDGEVYFEARPAPNDLIAWFQHHPYVDIGVAKTVHIGGVAGKRFSAQFDVPKGYVDVNGGSCSAPCIPMLQLGGDLVIHALERGSQDEFIVLEGVEGKEVIVWFSAPPEEFDKFLPKVNKVFDTVERRTNLTESLFTGVRGKKEEFSEVQGSKRLFGCCGQHSTTA